MSSEEQVVLSKEDDKEMDAACKKAQETFKYFWREAYWDSRRIIPALEVASVKIIFTDKEPETNQPNVEHMWINQVDFDGTYITGFLMNKPNWLRNISQGDYVKAKLSEVSDWMFAIEGKAYGAFTVNLLRSRMSPSERIDHDNAWQLDFGNPNSIRLVYFEEKKGFLSKLFGSNDEKEKEAMVEHPMSINMRESLLDELQESDELLTTTDDLGWTPLHREALAGNATSVSILIDHGADKNLTTHNGETPLDLAKKLNWDHVIEILL